MIKRVLKKIFADSQSRSIVILKNGLFTLIFKVASISIGIVMVPIALSYLENIRYGLWVAISEVLAWFMIFDIGIGNGLKNVIIKLKTKNDSENIKYYVSTAYFLFSIISIIGIVVMLLINRYINWFNVFNVSVKYECELKQLMIIAFIMVSFNFVLKLLNTILIADMKSYLSDAINFIGYLASFIGILVLTRISEPSLVTFAFVYSGMNVFVKIVISIVLYRGLYRDICPSIRFINFSYKSELLSVGIKFFFIQLMGVMLFQITNFIISNVAGPGAVTVYSITMKYFSFGMIFTMISQPLWSGFGDAYHKADYDWILVTFKRLKNLMFFISLFMLLLVWVQPIVFTFWLKDKVNVDVVLSLLCAVYLTANGYMGIYGYFINATGKLKLQMILLVINTPIVLFSIIFLARNANFFMLKVDNIVKVSNYLTQNIEAKIILILLIINRIVFYIFYRIQSHKIIKGSNGIWTE